MYRHELKYAISAAAARVLTARLSKICRFDSHAGPDGKYRVTSLYFDDFCNSAVADNLSGQFARKKFRIRIYNGSDALIRLERKTKRGGGCAKDSAPLTRDEYARIVAGDTAFLQRSASPVLRDFATTARVRLLRPRVVVDYEREAYVYEPGRVRITLDRQVRASVGRAALFDPFALLTPANGGVTILEVKYSGFLPRHIAAIIQSDGLRQAASKYTLCRMCTGQS